MSAPSGPDQRPRLRDLGVAPGTLPPGEHNTITDVPGVSVGHATLVEGAGELDPGHGPVRTGVTAIVPQAESLYETKVNAATTVLNGYGKAVGLSWIDELGTIETPVLLTNTLSVWRAADALHRYMADRHPALVTSNPVVGECYDGYLNDIEGQHVDDDDVRSAIRAATAPNTEEGNVGGGTGMTGFGWKGGIGTASRVVEVDETAVTLGALVQTNTGDPRDLRLPGLAVGEHLRPPGDDREDEGSIMIVVGTDAPLGAGQLRRVAKRAILGLGRVGGTAGHTSGDYVIAFSNDRSASPLDAAALTPLFRGTVEAVEEAISNSVLRAETMVGRDGNTRHAIPIDELTALLEA